jgi:hypothetical protein
VISARVSPRLNLPPTCRPRFTFVSPRFVSSALHFIHRTIVERHLELQPLHCLFAICGTRPEPISSMLSRVCGVKIVVTVPRYELLHFRSEKGTQFQQSLRTSARGFQSLNVIRRAWYSKIIHHVYTSRDSVTLTSDVLQRKWVGWNTALSQSEEPKNGMGKNPVGHLRCISEHRLSNFCSCCFSMQLVKMTPWSTIRRNSYDNLSYISYHEGDAVRILLVESCVRSSRTPSCKLHQFSFTSNISAQDCATSQSGRLP